MTGVAGGWAGLHPTPWHALPRSPPAPAPTRCTAHRRAHPARDALLVDMAAAQIPFVFQLFKSFSFHFSQIRYQMLTG